MTLTGIKAEPLAVWDVRMYHDDMGDRGLYWRNWQETSGWARAHIADVDSTYRVEFHLVDAPFAVVWRYKRNERGWCFTDPATGDVARAEPVVQMLDELPPPHLLGR
jgi:hypothetical protein